MSVCSCICVSVYARKWLSLLHVVFLSMASRVGMATKANNVCEIYYNYV